MAENRNKSGNGANWADESPFDAERAFSQRKSEAHMPPRNILETDSAKYTAEFVKGVVKGLYTADPDAYETGGIAEYELEGVGETPESSIEPAFERGRRNLTPRQVFRDEPVFAPEPEPLPEPRIIKRAERESAGAREEYGAFRQERPRPVKPEKIVKPAPSVQRDIQPEIPEEAVLAADGFLKAYEEKNRSEKPTFTKKPPRRTFSSLNSGESASELEGVLSGRQPKKHGGAARTEPLVGAGIEEEEEYVYIKQESYPKRAPAHEPEPSPEGEPYYRKISLGGPEIEEKDGFTSVSAYEQIEPRQQEKIPIIINKRIESKPRKTADDYRNISKNEYDRPARKPDSYPLAVSRGPNIIMAAFMVAAVIIIGLLVWKINSLSSGGSQYDAEEAASLREENSLIKKEKDELETKYNALLSENENLREENIRLAELTAPEPEPEAPEEPEEEQEPTPSADGLVDGYYTVKPGDNLWSIAERFMGDGDLYPQIIAANNLDPNQNLYTGLKLKIPVQ